MTDDGEAPGRPTADGTMLERGPQVRFEDVTTTLGDEVVLHRLNLELPPGQVTVLMGASGAGKTTLARQLVGLLRPDSGRISIGDRSVSDTDGRELRALRAQMGVMLGGTTLFDASVFGSLTVYENIAYPLRLRGSDDDAVHTRTTRWLHALQLDGLADRMPEELPAHTRRRVALGRALVADQLLVVLDDVDVCMDATTAAPTVRAIREAQRRTGATMLVTTHDITLARALGDRLAVLANRRIVASGSPAKLLEGVLDAADFDHRFRVMDSLGPSSIEVPDCSRENWTILIDQRLVTYALTALVVVVMLFALYRQIGPFGS